MKKILMMSAWWCSLAFAVIALAADFNGDGTDDICVYRPSNSKFTVKNVGNYYLGKSGDVPAVADYNGDGKDDVAVYRSSNSSFRIRGQNTVYCGQVGDVPVAEGGGGSGGDSLWTQSGSDIYYNSGNVGIGTTDTTYYRLTVTGLGVNILPVKISNSDAATSLYLGFGASAGATYAQIYSSGEDLVLQGSTGKDVGIGTTTPQATLHIRDTYPDLSLEGTMASQRWSLNIANDGDFFLWNDTLGSNAVRVQSGNNNVGIGTTDPGWKLEVSGAVMLENLTPPVPYQSGHAGIYAANGMLYAIDDVGNTKLLSPHDPETGEWIFYSKNVNTGRVVRVDMERMVRKIEELTGETFLVETYEKPAEVE